MEKIHKQRNKLWAIELDKNNGKEARAKLYDREKGTRCCLGVARDVYNEANGFPLSEDTIAGHPEKELAEWFGWDDCNRDKNYSNVRLLNEEGESICASTLNDQGRSHSKIASLVRKTFNL